MSAWGTWRPGESLVLELDDRSGEERSEVEREAMLNLIRQVVEAHDFKLRTWGGKRAYVRAETKKAMRRISERLVDEDPTP